MGVTGSAVRVGVGCTGLLVGGICVATGGTGVAIAAGPHPASSMTPTTRTGKSTHSVFMPATSFTPNSSNPPWLPGVQSGEQAVLYLPSRGGCCWKIRLASKARRGSPAHKLLDGSFSSQQRQPPCRRSVQQGFSNSTVFLSAIRAERDLWTISGQRASRMLGLLSALEPTTPALRDEGVPGILQPRATLRGCWTRRMGIFGQHTHT